MKRLALLFACATVGAGCVEPPTTLHIADQLTPSSVAPDIARDNGFGALPPEQPIPPHPSISWPNATPIIPLKVTVIRPRRAIPDAVQIRNLALGLQVPTNALGPKTQSARIRLDWNDGRGYVWSHDSDAQTLSFQQTQENRQPLTTRTPASMADMAHIADGFLRERGFADILNGNPHVQPDWEAWWDASSNAGYCMSTTTIAALRDTATQPSGVLTVPSLEKDACAAPEFPNLIHLTFSLSVDGLDVYAADGTPVPAADIIINATQKEVVSGIIRSLGEYDRSDYPSRSGNAIASTLGQSPIQIPAHATHEQMVLQWQDGPDGVWLIPALLVQAQQESQSGFTTLIRLTK